MTAKPPFSLRTFLAALFKPASNPAPSGIRKKRLTGLKGGRKRSRLTAYNAMKPVNQRMLEEAGQRDAYLRGEVSLSDVRRSLRDRAVDLGIAKPARRPVQQQAAKAPLSREAQVRAQVATYLNRTLRVSGRHTNTATIAKYSPRIPDYVILDVPTWDAGQIAHAASRGSIFDVVEAGVVSNPFWYR